jgi:hypothetical protein
MNKLIMLGVVVAMNFVTACATKTVTTGTPGSSPNLGAVIAAEAFAAGCDIASTDVSPQVAAWLTGPCVTAADGFAQALSANSPGAVINGILNTLTTAAGQIPSSANGFIYVKQGLALATAVVDSYLLLTGQSTTAVPAAAHNFFDAPKPHKVRWTTAEKARLKALHDKLARKVKK